MQKSIAILMTSLLLLAGCLGTVEDVVSEIVPGCDDESALNYDESADNSQACITEQILIEAVEDFILLVENGPSIGDSAGMIQAYSGDIEDTQADLEMTMIVTGDSIYMAQNMDSGMMQYSSEMWTFGNADGTTTHYGDVLGEKFHMVSEMSIDETLYEMLTDDETETDEEEDSEMDDVSPQMFDWTSGNFALDEVISEDDDLFYQFSADLKVTEMPEMVFANTVTLNSDLTFRSWSVDVDDNITSITILTMDEINEIMTMDSAGFEEQMPLPFTLDEAWGEDLSDLWGDETDTSGSSATGRNATEGYYFSMYDCFQFVNGDAMTNTSDMDEFNNTWMGLDLDDSMCGSELMENHTFTNTSLTFPEHFVFLDFEEEMIMGVYHDGMTLTAYFNNWSEMTEDYTGEYCDGTYDSTNDTCTWDVAEIVNADGSAIEMYDYEDESYFTMYYQYNESSESGIMMFPETYYMCADNSEYISADWVEDGYEDCEDGSDESGNVSGEGYFDLVYECYDILDDQFWNGTTDYEEFYNIWEETDLDDSMCGSNVEDTTAQGTGEFSLPTRFVMEDDGFEVLEHNETHLFTVYENWTEEFTVETCVGSYDSSTDTCLYLLGEIFDSDEDSFSLSNPEMNITFLYQINENTGSGLIMMMVDVFVCGSGETINSGYVDDGYEDCEDGSDESGDVGNEPEGYYFDMYDCQEFVNGAMMANTSDVMEFWNMWQDSFDDSYCGTEGPEDYNFTETNVTMPENFVLYDADENMTMSIMHDGMYVTMTWHNWSEETGDIYGDYCDGDYDVDNDSCTFYLAEIIEGDDSAISMYDLETGEEFLMLYQYNSSTHSGLMMFPEEYYMCADESDYVEVDSVNDGFEDCYDGSDEYDYSEPEVIIDLYELYDNQTWAVEGLEFWLYDYEGIVDYLSIYFDGSHITNMSPYDMNWDAMEEAYQFEWSADDLSEYWGLEAGDCYEIYIVGYDYDENYLAEASTYYCPSSEISVETDLSTTGYYDTDWNYFVEGLELYVYGDISEIGGMDMYLANQEDSGLELQVSDLVYESDYDAHVMEWGLEELYSSFVLVDGECYDFYVDLYDQNGDYLTGSYEYVCMPSDDEGEGGEGASVTYFFVGNGYEGAPYEGDISDWEVHLMSCEYNEDGEEDCTYLDGNSLSDAQQAGSDGLNGFFFLDMDNSGTLSAGDAVGISDDHEYDEVKLYDTTVEMYAEENPAMPGFTAIFGIVCLLGAALLRRNE